MHFGFYFEPVVSSAIVGKWTITLDVQPLIGSGITTDRALCGSITLVGYPPLARCRRSVARDRGCWQADMLGKRVVCGLWHIRSIVPDRHSRFLSGSCAVGTVPASYVFFPKSSDYRTCPQTLTEVAEVKSKNRQLQSWRNHKADDSEKYAQQGTFCAFVSMSEISKARGISASKSIQQPG